MKTINLSPTLSATQIARFIIAFTWIYHGLFPKLMHIAPLEKVITGSLGFNEQISYWITKSAGVGEVIFGVIFWFCYQNKLINYLNIAAMLGLFATVALLLPHLLFEAFNPVTTNLPIIACSLVLLSARKEALSK